MSNHSRTIIEGIAPGAAWRFAGLARRSEASLINFIGHLPTPNYADEFLVQLKAPPWIYMRRSDLNQLFSGSNRGLGNQFGIPHVKIKYDTQNIRSCQDAKAFLAGVDRAVTSVAYTRTFDKNTLQVASTDKGFVATMEATFRFDTARSKIKIPKFLWRLGCEKEREALRLYYVNLMIHELGHLEIAGQILRHAQIRFKGNGATKQAAEADVRTKINAYRNAMTLHYVDTSELYDAKHVSDHGRWQSNSHTQTYSANVPSTSATSKTKAEYPFPGGDDVHLECPVC